MQPDNHLAQARRTSRFETFEERLALSAQPLAASVPLQVEDHALEHPYGEFFSALDNTASLLEQLENTASTTGRSVQTMAATDSWTGLAGVRTDLGLTGRGQTVAIIDSGIAYDHRALGAGYGSGYRVVGGWDFAENDANPYDDAPAGFHGTHVAGIVGSSDPRYQGVASGVDLVALRVFDDRGAGNLSWVEQALQWVHQHRHDFANPITTVNLSLGSAWNGSAPPGWATLEDELAQLKRDGIFIAVSAGNSFASYKTPGLSYPAASSSVVPVASVDNDGRLSSFSQRHDRVLAAPGRSIMSTVPDYSTGGDGVANDFAASSGTSMAAPYLAGTSALVRQTMEMVGRTGITQDVIYQHLRQTADVVWDSITNASYLRVNVGNAIRSLLPSDDFGGEANTAYALGTLTNSRQLNGLIGAKSDLDAFRFVAGATGTARIRVAEHQELAANWTTTASGASVAQGELSFQVVAGQEYQVSLGTSRGIGAYQLNFQLDATVASPPASLGAVDFRQLVDQQVQGVKTYTLTAARSGLLTVEAQFVHNAGDVQLELYDSKQRLIASSRTSGNLERVDVTAVAGQTFQVRLVGVHTDVDLRIANLVTVNGTQVVVNGTAGDDRWEYRAGNQHFLTVNDVTYAFASAAVKKISLQGAGGRDSLAVHGSAANETATLRPGALSWKVGSFELQATNCEEVQVSGGGGRDLAYLYDSSGNDRLEARPEAIVLTDATDSYRWQVSDFDFTYAYAQSGNDQAVFYDSAGNDRWDAAPGFAAMQLAGRYYNYAKGFDACLAYASGGTDAAYFQDSVGTDTFVATPSEARMTDQRGTYSNSCFGFENVYAYSRQGGADTAILYDSAGNDHFVSAARSGSMRAADGSYSNYAEGFRNLEARAVNGGNDSAQIAGLIAVDRVLSSGENVTIQRNGTKSWLASFEKIATAAVSAQAASGDLRAVDAVFQRVGSWK